MTDYILLSKHNQEAGLLICNNPVSNHPTYSVIAQGIKISFFKIEISFNS